MNELSILVSVIVGLLAIIGSIWAVAARFGRVIAVLSYRFGQLETKVNTLWDFIVRRGKAAAVKKGWGEFSSPFRLNVQGLAVVQPFLDQFLPFYVDLLKREPPLTERDMYIEFERKFGDFILEKLCLPYGLSEGECLSAVVAACQIEYAKR